MKKKSGFTIPELLAVIAILGILITLSASVYTGVSRRVKQTTLNQKINYFKEKAYEYADDNDINNKTISLSQLIELGYVNAEHPENPVGERIDNPVDNSYLDCMSFTITKDLTDYQIDYDIEGSCELISNEEKEQEVTLERYIKENNNFIKIDDEWTNKPVYLLVKVKNMKKYTLSDNKIQFNIGGEVSNALGTAYCEEINTVSDPVNTCVNVKEISTNYIYNNKVYVNMELIENSLDSSTDNKSYRIAKEINVKIDNQIPTVRAEYDSSYSKTSIKVNLVASDGNGSGIYGYYFSEDDLLVNSTMYNFTAPEVTYVSKNGKYYLYAVDKAGNISQKEEVNIINIDKEGPEEFINYEKRQNWSRNDLTVNFGCKTDSKVGCGNEVTYSIYDLSHGENNIKTIVENQTVNSNSVKYTFHLDYMDVKARADDVDENGKTNLSDAEREEQARKWALEDEKINNNYISTARIVFTIKDNVGNSKKLTYDIPVMIDMVSPILNMRAGSKTARKWFFGLVTTGYNYKYYVSIVNKDKIPSGISDSSIAFSTSLTDVNKLKENPFNNWSDFTYNGSEFDIYVDKGKLKTFTFRAISNVGVPSYGAGLATDRSCTEILAAAAAGGVVGLGVGAFCLMLFGGPVGWVLAGAAAAGVALGAALCASN